VIENNKIYYSLKFTDRSQINGLLKQKGDYDDILIVKNGFITDTSISNIVFYNGNEWTTPATPLLKGTCRDKLLKEGKIKEEIIKINDLHKLKSFCLINAMICGDLLPIPIENIYI
jgi:4-amino-4-deoxychorismate lyase